MKKFKLITIFLSLMQLMLFNPAICQEVTLSIQESAGGCGLATNCAGAVICFDIGMTVDIDKDLDSYNIWLQYDQSVLSRVSGGSDQSCVLDDGQDTDIEITFGAYRVAGIPGSAYALTGGIEDIVHTICFSIIDDVAIYGSTLTVGGNLFGGALPTSVTFDDASTDDVPEETPLVLSEATVSCLSLLPVELLSFEAEKNGKEVDLRWAVASEYNNSHFLVERSKDGLDFSQIGSVQSKGNHSNSESYLLTDVSPIRGKNYYRLKQVDMDGKFSYSEIRNVNMNVAGEFALYQNEPNPFKGRTMIGFDLPESMSATLYIFNDMGKRIKEINGDFSAGYNKIELERSDLPASGIVYYHLQAGEFMASKKMIVTE